MSLNIFDGVITAMITPFSNSEIDYKSLENLINRQIDAGINGIVIGGSTGEGSSLNLDKYYSLIEHISNYCEKKIHVIAGMTAISTQEAVSKIKELTNLNIDGIMCTTPHYSRPEQEGIFKHFETIHDATSLPLMIYIVPGRTGCTLSDETLIKIMSLERFIAIKDAGGDMERPLRILPKVKNINMLAGDDSSVLSYFANGGTGCISAISNIFPRLCKQIEDSWKNGEVLKSLVIQRDLYPLYKAIFKETNPIGVKYALHRLGYCSQEIMLPLTYARESTRKLIDKEVERLESMEKNV